jgi:two-component system chemotaxis response regulator CheB
MDGLTFLGRLMTYYPLPVIIISSLTPEGSGLTLQALQLGAIEVLCKPGAAYTLGDMVGDLVATIRVAARTNIRRHLKNRPVAPPSAKQFTALLNTTQKVLAVGASTGGTVALEYLVQVLPPQTPGMLVVQHMPVQFTKSFAARLNAGSTVEVREAEHGDSVVTGVVLIAPGDRHMMLKRDGARYTVSLKQGPPVNRHCPSVDVLFNSVARTAGRNAIAAILTGMGADGARGLLQLRQAGARTIAQDEDSCVVFGMPKVAIELGGAEEVLNLIDIPRRMLEMVQQVAGTGARSSRVAGS